ncbi:MAG: hypothetical protein C6P37_14945 [Caldibacillus debilis]|uniref:DUF5680 domain-containing protein n=1 Tax=Caldibacillus debilis TaxID=301148 RepID=A0A3E0JY42_9BACI|nr:DUF5680 domain-containing protein [Caldibacillus debilis]REJ25220.1 MAG: hypothetical protein C6P37_14945 [Caldibacillus debilis]
MAGEKRFVDFLIRAKKATYAAQGDDASTPPLLAGSRQLEYREGDYFYRDIYFGMGFFAGQEVVYIKDKPVWSMCYAGGVEKGLEHRLAKAVYAFLRKALRNAGHEQPYRGPVRFAEGEWIYRNGFSGGLEWFAGEETIALSGKTVYRLHYSGGFIR